MANAQALAEPGFEEVLDGVRRVGAEAARRADELDRLGVVPDDLYDDLASTGCLQAMVPRAHGGLEFSLAEVNALIAEASIVPLRHFVAAAAPPRHQVATQHVAATTEGYRVLGALLVGKELTSMELF